MTESFTPGQQFFLSARPTKCVSHSLRLHRAPPSGPRARIFHFSAVSAVTSMFYLYSIFHAQTFSPVRLPPPMTGHDPLRERRIPGCWRLLSLPPPPTAPKRQLPVSYLSESNAKYLASPNLTFIAIRLFRSSNSNGSICLKVYWKPVHLYTSYVDRPKYYTIKCKIFTTF